jgi:hypothetical protein
MNVRVNKGRLAGVNAQLYCRTFYAPALRKQQAISEQLLRHIIPHDSGDYAVIRIGIAYVLLPYGDLTLVV